MARFNEKVKTKPKTIINKAGGFAFKQSPELELVSLLLTSFVQDKFYESKNDQIERLRAIVKNSDLEFAAKAGLYARLTFGMRSITHVLAGEIAEASKSIQSERKRKWLKHFFDKIIFRVDDMTEILSYFMGEYGKPIPNSIKKGFGKAFARFNGYQLAKYKGEGKSLTLVDVVNLIHPKPVEGNRKALQDLMTGKLKNTETWESKLSEAGKTDDVVEAKADAWDELISENKLPYFALLRNLRNILEQAPELTPKIIKLLVNKEAILKSKIFPFQFQNAIEALGSLSGQNTRKVISAAQDALDISVSNCPVFEGSTCVVLDVSGSMTGKPAQIGSLFSAILCKSNNADMMIFSDRARYVEYNPKDSVSTIANSFRFSSGGTNFHAIFQTLDKSYDRIIILSDMQGWVSGGAPTDAHFKYRKRYGDPFIYSFDLAGHGSLMFPEKKVFAIAGFSEKIFDVIQILEEDRNILIKKIKDIEL